MLKFNNINKVVALNFLGFYRLMPFTQYIFFSSFRVIKIGFTLFFIF